MSILSSQELTQRGGGGIDARRPRGRISHVHSARSRNIDISVRLNRSDAECQRDVAVDKWDGVCADVGS